MPRKVQLQGIARRRRKFREFSIFGRISTKQSGKFGRSHLTVAWGKYTELELPAAGGNFEDNCNF